MAARKGNTAAPSMATASPAGPPAILPRYVELVRVSTSGQADRDTPATQRAALDRLRDSRPGILVDRIEERGGISGGLPFDQRPDLMKLRDLAEARAFDELRVAAVDRLTRAADPRERFAVYGMVSDAGAIIVEASGREIDPADESGIGEIDFYLQILFAARERKKIKDRTHAGRLRAASNGRCVGKAPFGLVYDQNSGLWSFHPTMAAVVRRVFDLADTRSLSSSAIALLLNAEGVLSPQNTTWSYTAVCRILRNPTYAGDLRVAFAVKGSAPNVIRSTIEPLIPLALWERVQDKVAGRRVGRGRGRPLLPLLLRRLVLCGACGLPMRVEHTRGRGGKPYCYYRCGSQWGPREEHCENRRHSALATDEVVWAKIRDLLESSDVLSQAAGESDGPEQESEWEQKIEEGERQLADLDKRALATVQLAGEEALIPASVSRRALEGIKSRRLAVEADLKVARKALAAARARQVKTQGLEERLADLRQDLATATFDERREIMQLLVPNEAGYGIRLHPDGQIEVIGAVALGPEARKQPGDRVDRRFGGTGRSAPSASRATTCT